MHFNLFGQTENSKEIDEQFEIEFDTLETVFLDKIADTSKLNFLSKNLGYDLIDFSVSPCLKPPTERNVKNDIFNSFYSNDTLTLEINVTANCCNSFLAEIQVKNDSTINLIYSGYGDICLCNCCFNLRYTILTNRNEFTEIQINGKK